jgi:phosphoglycolate phosphatase
MSEPFRGAVAGDVDHLLRLLPEAHFVFDWNGTLIDDAARTLTALNATRTGFGMTEMDDDVFRHTFHLPMESFLAEIGFPGDEIAAALNDWQRGIEAREAPLAIGAEETLRVLHERGRPAGVISAGFTAGVERDAARLGIRGWLDFLHGSVASKSAVLREVLAATPPIVYVGDTEYDMREAVVAGAVPVGFGGGYRPGEALLQAGAIAVIDDFRVLLGTA